MIFGKFLIILGCIRFFWGPKRTIYNLIRALFFHRCLDSILEGHLHLKKVGLRWGGRHIATQFNKKINKNANFTGKKLSHRNYCYWLLKVLDIGAHTVKEFWDYLNKQKKLQPLKVTLFFIFWPISEFFSNLGVILGYFKGLKSKNCFF